MLYYIKWTFKDFKKMGDQYSVYTINFRARDMHATPGMKLK